MDLRLFYSPGACSLGAHILLEEAHAPFEAVRVTIAEGATRTPEYLAINPHARVPALQAEGRNIAESAGVMTYIARRFPAAKLIPDDPLDAARVYELLSFFSSSVHIAFAQIWRAGRFVENDAHFEPVQAKGKASVVAYCAEIDQLVSGKDYLVGDTITAADVYPLIFLRWANRVGIDTKRFADWRRHGERMLARPAVQRAIASEGLKRDEFLPA